MTDAKAAFTHTSTGPRVSSTHSAAARTCAASDTSTRREIAGTPASRASLSAQDKPSSPRARRARAYPRRANSRTVARPTPALAPLTTTTPRFPLRSRMSFPDPYEYANTGSCPHYPGHRHLMCRAEGL